MRTRMRNATWGVLLIAGLGAAAAPATAQLSWASKDEKMNFKIGLLAQMQGEQADVAGSNDTATNLYFRRLRLLMGFTLGEKLSVFMETDSPNLGKSNNAGVKDANDVYIQDFVVTYKFTPKLMLDGGMLLLDQSYNHLQSAASLLTTDYGPYSFVESGPTGERVGRDYGLRLRGYGADNHLEYRAGVYQGQRGTNATNDLRYGARLMYSFFTPQVGLFYRGTSLGKTRTLSFGASYDSQEKYDSFGFDVFYDQPLGGGNAFTFQADYTNPDGGTFLTALPQQTDMLFEAGFYIASAKLQPFVQYATQNFDAVSRVDEERLTGGLTYYAGGHNNNFKLSYTEIKPDIGKKRSQINLQWQVFQF